MTDLRPVFVFRPDPLRTRLDDSLQVALTTAIDLETLVHLRCDRGGHFETLA